MSYEEKLLSLEHFSVSGIINISKELLPKHIHKPWELLGHGIEPIKNETELLAYIVAYGEMHYMKCRASFQNFDFKKLNSNIEIIDWGCGQGIGSLTFIEMLRDRDKSHLVRKVTLIEPSEIALTRARININKATNGSCQILTVNKYLPGKGNNDEIEGIHYVQKNVIHIFSNILDIPSVNLEKLANIVGELGHTHFVMCMGPLNTNSYRIAQFCNAFNVDDKAYFSSIKDGHFGRTSDTEHNFSCVTKCFEYNGEGLNISNMKQFVEPNLVCGRPIYNDYDPMLAVQNGLISKDLHEFYTYLEKKLTSSDHVYLKPIINGDAPDIIILRPNTGLMVIKVFEEDINQYQFFNKESSGSNYNLIEKNNNIQLSPLVIVKSYQQNLIQLHIADMLGKSLIDTRYWSTIKTVVYFSKNTTSEIKYKFKDVQKLYTTTLGKDIIKDSNFDFFKETYFNYTNNFFDSAICNSFLRIISPDWHSYRQGIFIALSKPQEELIKSKAGTKQKVNGVAGSGKTQVLATRAVKAHLRTGKKVLVLTFNLSLVNYLRYRIGQVREDFYWDKFLIINYHQFFIAEANNHGLKMDLSSFENESFFSNVRNRIHKYSTILIDEVQDYRPSWLTILANNFLEPNGELVVFGDAKQNIYKRALDSNNQIKIGLIPGIWNDSLKTGYRFSNPLLTSLALEFQKVYFPERKVDEIQQDTSMAFDTCIKYFNIGKNINPDTLEANCRWVMHEFSIAPKDIVVLSQTCNILRDIDHSYRTKNRLDTLTTFESKEQYDKLRTKHQIANDETPINNRFRDDINQIRRNKKIHFSMDTNVLKLSTIHSFKGWESSTVILILEPEQTNEQQKYTVRPEENSEELIYTAITRCKENLFVINCGNEKFHHFFNKFCNR